MVVLGVDPQLRIGNKPGLPQGYDLVPFCAEVIEACAPYVAAVKFQLAFFEARGIEGMKALKELLGVAKTLGLVVIADAKRGDISTTSEAYAEAFLGAGSDFESDAACVNPYLGSDAIMPFVSRTREGKGLFVLVRTSNGSSGEFQDLSIKPDDIETRELKLWERIAIRASKLGDDIRGECGLSSVGAVIGATHPTDARRARDLMPNTIMLVPGYGAQGATAKEAVAGARHDGSGIVVNASRSLMYAYLKTSGIAIGQAAALAANEMRKALNGALAESNVTRDLQPAYIN